MPTDQHDQHVSSTQGIQNGFITVAAVFLGALVAIFFPSLLDWLPLQLGDLFIRLLKLIAPPLAFFACLRALLGMGDAIQLKKVGTGAVVYYLSTSALAAFVGACLSMIFLGGASYQTQGVVPTHPAPSSAGILEKLVPSNLVSPFLDGEILQLIILGIALALLILRRSSDERASIYRSVSLIDDLINDAARVVLSMTPLAAFCISAQLTHTLDWKSLTPFTHFIWVWGGATLIHSAITLPLLLWLLTRSSPWQFFVAVREALLIALTTASSAGTLPASKRVLEENTDVSKEASSFILPLGATINMDGSALYQAQLLLFMCVAEGRSLTLTLITTVIGLVLLSSAGTSAIPRGGIAMMGMMIAYLGLPPLYLGIYIAIDQILDYPITAVNVWGDLVGARVIDQHLKKE